MTAINLQMFGTPKAVYQSSNINQLSPELGNIAYQVNNSLLAGNNVSSTYTTTNTAALNYGITGSQSAKIYANQSGQYFSGCNSGEHLSTPKRGSAKRGEFTPFAKGDFSHLSKEANYPHWQGLIGVTTQGRIEFFESIKKGGQSATLGNVDIKYRASENINISLLLWYGKYQLLGSMPRDCNSFRITLLIHAARDSSPSCACATSIISLSSGSSLNWNGGFPRLSVLCVDTSITPVVWYLCVITHYTLATQKTMPRSGGTLTGHLTTNDNTSIEVAMSKHNTPVTGRTSLTPNQSYRWLFLALNRSDYTAKPCRIAVTAPNEHDARLMLVRDYILSFAGRLPAQEAAHA